MEKLQKINIQHINETYLVYSKTLDFFFDGHKKTQGLLQSIPIHHRLP